MGAPLHALIVGLGSIGRRHARNWARLGLGPVSICRQVGAAQPESLDIAPAPREFRALDEALTARPDVVFITNPTSLHVPAACQALAAGAHVFVEKPLSHTLEGIDDLLRVARQRERHVFVGYNLRFHPGPRRLRELYHAGAIGAAVSARAEAGEFLPDWHPWEDYRGSYSARRELGGGALLTLSHDLDALCWVLGAPARLTAFAAHASTLETDTEDVAEVLLEFASGALGSVHVDYLRQPPHRALEIVGEQGVLRWEYEANRVMHYSAAAGQWRIEAGDPRYERNAMYLAEAQHVADCVRGEVERPLIDGQQAAAVVALTLAAMRAASRGGSAITLAEEGEPVTAWLSQLGRP